MVEQESKEFTESKQAVDAEEHAQRQRERFASLAILEAFIHLLNKRPQVALDFKQMNGYALLQRIFTAVANLNRFQAISTNVTLSRTYFAAIQLDLFSVLVNGCFRRPVICISDYSKEKIQICCSIQRVTSASGASRASRLAVNESDIYLINVRLLSKVLIEWSLWQTFAKDLALWKHIFQVNYFVFRRLHFLN